MLLPGIETRRNTTVQVSEGKGTTMFEYYYQETKPGVCELADSRKNCRGLVSKYVNPRHPEWAHMWRCEFHVPLATVGWAKAV